MAAITLCLVLSLTATTAVHAASLDGAPPDYQPPTDTAGLQIVELLPHAQSCSPTDTDPLCGDYIKLLNSSDNVIDLGNYRLRSSYGGLNGSSRNTFSLDGSLDPSQYLLINARDDGSPLSLTDSGGYVWLEDAYGSQVYEPVVEYPDASASSKVGQAWAFDGTQWKWTDSPQPAGPNYFPVEPVGPVIPEELPAPTYKPCAANQVRNPETHRCRKIADAVKALVPCKPGQVRNPATNRCRSTKSTAKTLTPCKPGKVRNPATNRCHSITSTIKTKKPCKPDQERSPETGRCRKKQPKISNIHDIKTASKSDNQHWYVVAGVIAAAGAYIWYEWRQEFNDTVDRLKVGVRGKVPGGQRIGNLVK